MSERVAKKNTGSRAILKFVGTIRPEPWKTQTAKSFKLVVVWNKVEEFFIWRFIGKGWCGKAIDKVNSC